MVDCYKCHEYIKYAMYEHEVGGFVYCFDCSIGMIEKFLKIKKRINRWYDERYDTNHDEMANMLMKFQKVMNK